MERTPLRFVDLFCGIGSFHYSLVRQLGWQCVFACDINANARKTYADNYGLVPAGDICAIDPATVPPFDVLCAGFPCQPFSVAGQHGGFEDKNHGNMFFELMRFVRHHRPSAVMLENVHGLENHDNGRTISIIVTTLKELGYTIHRTLLKCSDYGIPQMRKRLFIVAIRGVAVDFTLDFSHARQPSNLSAFLNAGRPAEQHMHFIEKTVAYTIRCGGKQSPIDDGHNWDGYRVKRGDGEPFVYRLTIEDCIKLQGFDAAFQLTGSDAAKWKMIGNTIPTIFTRLVGAAVQGILERA